MNGCLLCEGQTAVAPGQTQVVLDLTARPGQVKFCWVYLSSFV